MFHLVLFFNLLMKYYIYIDEMDSSVSLSVDRFQSRPTGMFFLETVWINNFNIFLHLFRNNDSRSSGLSCTHVHVYSRLMYM